METGKEEGGNSGGTEAADRKIASAAEKPQGERAWLGQNCMMHHALTAPCRNAVERCVMVKAADIGWPYRTVIVLADTLMAFAVADATAIDAAIHNLVSRGVLERALKIHGDAFRIVFPAGTGRDA